MEANILILTESPFSKRDYDRFGIEILSRNFRIRVLDCTPWISPHFWEKHSEIRYEFPGYFAIGDWNAFVHRIGGITMPIAIDCLGSENCTPCQSIRRELKSRDGLRAILQLGLIPAPSSGVLGQMRAALQRGDFFRKVVIRLNRAMREVRAPALTADIAVLSGEAGLRDPHVQVRHQIWAHSFDYDIYLKLQDQPENGSEPYAVLLDEDIVHHSDYFHGRIRSPATEQSYYGALSSFLERFEHDTGLRTIIAAHPRSQYDARPHLWAGRNVIVGKTAELVRDAKLVFAHASTSISFAVLWRKPMVFLTTDELQSSFMATPIATRSKLFDAPLVNMDRLDRAGIDLKTWLRIDGVSYANYMRMYVKRPGTPERPVWEIFSEYVRRHMSSRV